MVISRKETVIPAMFLISDIRRPTPRHRVIEKTNKTRYEIGGKRVI